eukprot:s1390_g10.t1
MRRTQVWCLTQREWRNLRRDSASLKLRFVLTAFLTMLFSLVFSCVGQHPILQKLRRKGPLHTLLVHPSLRRLQRIVYADEVTLLQQLQQEIEYHYKAVVQVGFTAMFSASQPTILSFPLERPVFLREYSSNMYGTFAYFLSKMFVEVPLGAAQALLALSISHHYMRFQGEFWEMWATVCLLNACAVSFSLLIGCLVLTDVRYFHPRAGDSSVSTLDAVHQLPPVRCEAFGHRGISEDRPHASEVDLPYHGGRPESHEGLRDYVGPDVCGLCACRHQAPPRKGAQRLLKAQCRPMTVPANAAALKSDVAANADAMEWEGIGVSLTAQSWRRGRESAAVGVHDELHRVDAA